MKLTNKAYDVLKWIVMVCLPALTTAYVGLDKLFGWGYAAEVAQTSAIVCTLIGITILVAGLVTPLQEGFDGSRMLLTFLVDIPGMIFISGGIGLFVYYFAGKKMLAKEIEAEEKGLLENK